MRTRFASEARRIVVGAERLASRMGDPAVTPEHLLLALAEASTTPAARALASAGLDLDALEASLDRDRNAVLESVGITVSGVPADRPAVQKRKVSFAPAFKRALEQALRAALAQGDRRIGSEHLLLGLIQIDKTRVPRLLAAEGVDVEDLRAAFD